MTMSHEIVADARLKRLLDREEISDVQLRYATGVDSRDWQLFRSCFTDEVEGDYSSVFGTPPAHLSADDFVAMIAPVMSALTATQHMITNLAVTFDDDDHATVVAYVRAIHHNATADGDTEQTVYGYYTNSFVRTADGWRISKLKLTSRIQTGNPGVFGALPAAG
ncbi:nuclear transport factor 2 family protein [Mycolicibacterium senegalense]|uniref:Bile acid 7-alpha dehydratase n=3 Tax=Mycolicibacterium TaxID=1866885 RepID=A0A378SWA8_9MYCO|nr:nuclear transport factor 2 family protein [Mycolicibacterium senegalense]MCV7334129.1 nuclear transport factor 2 family protein [Mycolicibacterium senegalense]MDR7292181.1 3-phenylpropionate/cinnamic acid dioxygenase small subunit [Mycolicibacterium senegalense]STZ52777.1 bile acid 7-alpha dehydratase [Mycolicibacterium senegalense]